MALGGDGPMLQSGAPGGVFGFGDGGAVDGGGVAEAEPARGYVACA